MAMFWYILAWSDGTIRYVKAPNIEMATATCKMGKPKHHCLADKEDIISLLEKRRDKLLAQASNLNKEMNLLGREG